MEIVLKLEPQEIDALAETAKGIVGRILDARRASEDLASETAASIAGSLSQVALAIADKVVTSRTDRRLDEILSAVNKPAKKSKIVEETVAYEDLPTDVQETIRRREPKRAGKVAYAKTAGRID